MKTLTAEYLATATMRLNTAATVAGNDPATALSTAYYAGLYAARAALHEHDISARSHRGTWHEFRNHFVLAGHVSVELATAMQRLQTAREQADYDAAEVAAADALRRRHGHRVHSAGSRRPRRRRVDHDAR